MSDSYTCSDMCTRASTNPNPSYGPKSQTWPVPISHTSCKGSLKAAELLWALLHISLWSVASKWINDLSVYLYIVFVNHHRDVCKFWFMGSFTNTTLGTNDFGFRAPGTRTRLNLQATTFIPPSLSAHRHPTRLRFFVLLSWCYQQSYVGIVRLKRPPPF